MRLDLAGAAGWLDAVSSLLEQATGQQWRDGFLFACAYGQDSMVQFLLEKKAPMIGGHPDTVKLLLRHNPPLEAENPYGWSAAHGANSDVYPGEFWNR